MILSFLDFGQLIIVSSSTLFKKAYIIIIHYYLVVKMIVELPKELAGLDPNTKIYVLRGMDMFDLSNYTKGAYFDESKLREAYFDAMSKPNGSEGMSDQVYFLEGTLRDLRAANIKDPRKPLGREALDSGDISKIYQCLLEQVEPMAMESAE